MHVRCSVAGWLIVVLILNSKRVHVLYSACLFLESYIATELIYLKGFSVTVNDLLVSSKCFAL